MANVATLPVQSARPSIEIEGQRDDDPHSLNALPRYCRLGRRSRALRTSIRELGRAGKGRLSALRPLETGVR